MLRKLWTARRVRNVLLAISTPLALTACATATGTGATKVYCGASAYIDWSVHDTDDTIKQAKKHNAKRRALCGA